MSDLRDHIHSIDAHEVAQSPDTTSLSVIRQAEGETPSRDWGIVPWLWIAAWLILWALLVAIAAWWVGAGEVGPRAVWMWVLIWAVPGLVVSGLLTRAAAQATERAGTLLRLSNAHREIALLETRLQASTASMLQATRTLTEATDILLEQVDTSRDDLRNQIRSARGLADALKTQTEGLVDAGSRLSRQPTPPVMSSDDAVADGSTGPVAQTTPTLNLRPFAEDMAVPTEQSPPMGLRPGPEDSAVFESAAEPALRTDWSWSDMLQSADPDAVNGAASVIALMGELGLSPQALVDEGNVLDALHSWNTQGRDAMGQLLSIRFDEPARLFRSRLDEDAEARTVVEAFSELYAEEVERMSAQERLQAASSEAGKAWLFSEAVLAL